MTVTPEQTAWFQETFSALVENVEQVVLGKRHVIELAFTALVSQGHLLLEDFPGTGKTSLARAMAQSVKGLNNRIQFTPDLLPGDITGVSIYDQRSGSFEFHRGPIFANIVLADEINRASPKTQAALLEVMEEGHVTVDGVTHDVGAPFMVIATQNPIEQAGTYRLPEAQLDRFIMKASIGYPDHASTLRILFRHMLPSFLSHIIAVVSLAIPSMILAETALSYLGIGLRVPIVSWGVLLQEAQNVHTIANAPWLLLPGLAVVIAVLSLNFLGDGLRDAADPYSD